jgi:hypothetical protein
VSLARYTLIVLGTVLGSLALLWPALADLGELGRAAALFGGLLAAANALIAYATVLVSEKRSPKVFLGAVLGGMLGRMAALLLAVVAAILVLELPKVPLAVSLLAYFVLFLGFELSILHRKTTPRAMAS